MCEFNNVCLAFSDGDCPTLYNPSDDCPGRYINFCPFCYRCLYWEKCKLECENEARRLESN